MLATKPTPQESFSNEGLYNPVLLISFNSLKIFNDRFFESINLRERKVGCENADRNFQNNFQNKLTVDSENG
jgi:hypothetical protein